MKALKTLFTSVALVSAFIAPSALANDIEKQWLDGMTDEHCVVTGVEKIRTPRYEDTAETREIMALERKLCQQLMAGVYDELGESLHEHGIILLEEGGILQGRDQQVAMFKQFIGEMGVYLSYEPAEAHVSKDGTMAWAIGLVKFQMPGQKLEIQKYTSIWEKEDGEWLNVVEMRNKNY
ncbi:DUF4440 domain-containing protein [Vibrio sp. D173a]|uniref:nuclear transport factor 2 family protein n=1 Tax=Vibrio sp. D173a TaxID=2836349 RepID=UPI0025536371|nr:nuclear transport factor 2 family protein [Vibrio sp. D173a]MDK9759130.1 DUF4440 domain-containing protein [Vibrio sp. D173a]